MNSSADMSDKITPEDFYIFALQFMKLTREFGDSKAPITVPPVQVSRTFHVLHKIAEIINRGFLRPPYSEQSGAPQMLFVYLKRTKFSFSVS